jgi:SAM-dependent methyltransferase
LGTPPSFAKEAIPQKNVSGRTSQQTYKCDDVAKEYLVRCGSIASGRLLLLFVLCLAAAPVVLPQSAPPRPRATSTPYTGDLSIFDRPGRDERLQIDRVMDVLHIKSGKTVADIGAGSGWFTVRAAERVTKSGMVYAVDINPEAIDYIDNRVRKSQLHNVKTILSKPDNPELPSDSVDSVLLLKCYHEVADPVTLLRNLRTSLKPGARVGIIDRDSDAENHGVHKQIVLQEASEAGYRLIEEHDDLVKADNVDYFLVLVTK